MSTDLIQIERIGHVAVLRLNRPEVRNAINVELAAAIVDAMASPCDARALVITGHGAGFCAGLDLRNLGTDNLKDLPSFLAAVHDCSVPVIAAVNGAAVTGGFDWTRHFLQIVAAAVGIVILRAVTGRDKTAA